MGAQFSTDPEKRRSRGARTGPVGCPTSPGRSAGRPGPPEVQMLGQDRLLRVSVNRALAAVMRAPGDAVPQLGTLPGLPTGRSCEDRSGLRLPREGLRVLAVAQVLWPPGFPTAPSAPGALPRALSGPKRSQQGPAGVHQAGALSGLGTAGSTPGPASRQRKLM